MRSKIKAALLSDKQGLLQNEDKIKYTLVAVDYRKPIVDWSNAMFIYSKKLRF